MPVEMKKPVEELAPPMALNQQIIKQNTGVAAFMAFNAAFTALAEKFPESKTGLIRQLVTQG